jgi:maltose alpha-D-glucosyltransferase/alpha-amylase
VRVSNDGERNSLAVAQQFVRNQGDAWAWTLDQFNRALDDLATREGSSETGDDKVTDYASIATAIGKRLREMHGVLARPSDDPAFAPEEADERDIEAWIERASSSLDRAFASLKSQKSGTSETLEAETKLLLSHHASLSNALHSLAQSGIGSAKTRIHGDFHLGQVLVTSGDVYIIDFEGEPGRPLSERRAKASPLRDVAGLMRSFDYAAATTLDPKNVTAARLSTELRERLVTYLRDSAQHAFLEAYYASAAPEQRNSDLLEFFLIEKAAYELAYEAANRPAWMPIPINGLLRLAKRIAQHPRSAP